MNSKKIMEEMLDLLVKMSEHCKNRKREVFNKSKCFNCEMHMNFSITRHGCFLVDTLENYEFIDLIKDVCEYQNIEYKNKLNKVMEIFEEEYTD